MARAFAKVILFGEHAVVHGRTAIAGALDIGARAEARTAASGDTPGPSSVHIRTWERLARVGDDDDLARAWGALLEASGAATRPTGGSGHAPIHATVDVDVPGGAGLGCSAAIGVSLARAVADARGVETDDDTVERCADAWERVFHGNPSGVDVAVATRGGVLAYRKGTRPRVLRAPAPIEIAIGYTREPSSTRSMVEQVARQLARRPQVVERTFDGIDTLALKAAGAIEAGRWYEVGRLMDLNHALLASLMVSSEALERACAVARDAGAAGAKLTGGGGGGCIVALAPGCAERVAQALRRDGFDAFATTITATGIGSTTSMASGALPDPSSDAGGGGTS